MNNHQYILFGGDSYYAQGGLLDLLSFHPTMDEAVREGIKLIETQEIDSVEWWHVWDAQACKVVGRSERQAYRLGSLPTWFQTTPIYNSEGE